MTVLDNKFFFCDGFDCLFRWDVLIALILLSSSIKKDFLVICINFADSKTGHRHHLNHNKFECGTCCSSHAWWIQGSGPSSVTSNLFLLLSNRLQSYFINLFNQLSDRFFIRTFFKRTSIYRFVSITTNTDGDLELSY